MSERIHHLKCHPEFFGDVVAGVKTFEVRKDDRGFVEGDELMLYQWPQPDIAPHNFEQVAYRIPKFLVRVTYVLRGGDWGIERGYVVMGIVMSDSLRMRLVDAGADAMEALPYDTIELRNWGESSVADPARVLTTAALDAMLDCLAENADEWADYPAEAETSVWAHRAIIARKLVKALREDR